MGSLKTKHIVVKGRITKSSSMEKHNDGSISLSECHIEDINGVKIIFKGLFISSKLAINHKDEIINNDANIKLYIYRAEAKNEMTGIVYAVVDKSDRRLFYLEDMKMLRTLSRIWAYPATSASPVLLALPMIFWSSIAFGLGIYWGVGALLMPVAWIYVLARFMGASSKFGPDETLARLKNDGFSILAVEEVNANAQISGY